MKLGVAGLWHLGSVTAACMAEHMPVVAWDPSRETIDGLSRGKASVAEPGLDDLIAAGLASGNLRFTTELQDLSDVDVLWITFDTPVDDEDQADVAFVESQVALLVPALRDEALVLVSSQVPVGFTRSIASSAEAKRKRLRFAYSPENLRLGGALNVFRRPDRIVVGADSGERERIAALLAPIGAPIEWMSIASAEMTKHALNAFLATSVSFINEIATIAERVGADGAEVHRGLTTDIRIGPRAYLRPGAAFAGGTLARDVVFLSKRAAALGVPATLLGAVKTSNDEHKGWAWRWLQDFLQPLEGRRVAILGLTYKAGTDTLRRSASLELAAHLSRAGVCVSAFDPANPDLPADVRGQMNMAPSIREALRDAEAVVIGTDSSVFRALTAEEIVQVTRPAPLVLDPARVLPAEVAKATGVRYVTVGSARTWS